MLSLSEINRSSSEAEARELAHLNNRVHELESILDLPHAGVSTNWAWLRRREQNLLAQVRIDPDNPETQTEPITGANIREWRWDG